MIQVTYELRHDGLRAGTAKHIFMTAKAALEHTAQWNKAARWIYLVKEVEPVYGALPEGQVINDHFVPKA